MDGLIFFLNAWIIWIYLIFFAQGKAGKSKIAGGVLLLSIILSPLYVEVGGIKIYGGGLCLFFCSVSFLYKAKLRKIIFLTICSVVLSAIYSSLKFFELFDPVIFIINREWIVSIILAIVAIILQRSVKWRLMLVAIGTFQGEVLVSMVLRDTFSLDIGGYAYLDALSMTAAFVLFWSFLEAAKTWLNSSIVVFERNKKSSS
ncbi:hypothetical protein D1B31_09910 [Neobacillus notoginsengisoli]|uniref:Uncharacterized protein n=1 Tax=Neobacillus notoginsengisoli TaxID=1578198 RepID=A0A417YVA6_9BACI|nr:hypothetical protein [Neobacillus notoginsengisoli]RHW41236.1 hypothetical protein D1B31_09910 [Neobacillus notoginsengisoli]